MHSIFGLFAAFFPPDLSPHYLLALVPSVVDSVGMATATMLIAYAVSLPLGLAVGTVMPGARFIQSSLAALRAIPDLTLAIFCVVLVGIGPGAGTLALAIFYTAAVAKIFGDLFGTARQQPLEALGATGASRFQVALFGLLPLKLSDLLTYGSYEFESAVRASVIVGAVGGGGLGISLVLASAVRREAAAGELCAIPFAAPEPTKELFAIWSKFAVPSEQPPAFAQHLLCNGVVSGSAR